MKKLPAALSGLDLAILGLLAQQPRSGYDIRKLFATTALGHFSDSPGAIYPALKRCEKKGWIRGRVANPRSRRPRRVFSLTPAGRGVFRSSLLKPLTRDDIVRRSEEVILRFAFIGENLGANPARRFIEGYLREVESYLRELRAQATASKDSMSIYGRLSMRLGIEGYKLDARWARGVLKELK